MKKIAACALEDHNHFVNIFVTDEAMSVALFSPYSGDQDAISSDQCGTFLNQHNTSPFMLNNGIVVAGADLKEGLAGKFICIGKTTYFSSPVAAKNASVECYGSGEITDRRSMAWFVKNGWLSAPTTRNPMSYFTKAGTMRTLQLERMQLAVQLIMPFASESVTSDYNSIQFNYSPTYGYRCNLPVEEFTLEQLQNHGNGWSPNPVLALSGPESTEEDKDAEFSVSMSWEDGTAIEHDSEIYIDSTGGYVPLRRLELSNGVGKFRIRALGLKAGESFKVKVGWRYFTGAAEKTVLVV
ncbi:hypothetical protein MUN46_011725 [Mesosutterella sp. AGMB02718]|uniref:Uncharacterized protein n=1 Tax=Mesosutterella faecium TaxID=2925194 RepID=A0ABT7ITG0_9BURK|nr:hypothetical protein [Mesosutterella sp. AGMB02718]MDL2058370.1 hypothetical protein [Mesosutterella sp. AGMB02718]MDL2060606.1 hypothetical protein [Mesosutterella sp. AGMB02718]